jgi:hypothetical protein
MSEGWLTRAEREARRDKDPVETPEAPARAPQPQGPKDLAALQRQQQSKRQRSSVAAAQQAERERRQQQLTRKAEREENLSAARRLLANPWLRRAVIAVIVVALLGLVVVPATLRLLDPPLSQDKLEQSRGPIDADASKYLGARAGTPKITLSADQQRLMMQYTVPTGHELFRGGKVKHACFARYAVDRAASTVSKLVFERVDGKRCR